MLLLIIISVLQISILPGCLLCQICFKKLKLQWLLYYFALSLITNYLIVTTLVFFELYTKKKILIFFFIELIVLIVLIYKDRKYFFWYDFNKSSKQLFDRILVFFKFKNDITYYFQISLFAVVSFIIIKFLIFYVNSIGSIFNSWDAVVSWNRWAIDLFNNRIPQHTWHYPQLLPVNWSISYVIMGYPFQYISKAMMPLFLIFMVLSSFFEGIKYKSTTYLLVPILITIAYYRFAWNDGYADVPVGFFSFLSISCLLKTEKMLKQNEIKNFIILGSIIACGTAVTKQAGLFLIIVYPILAFYLTKNNFTWTAKIALILSLMYIFFITVIVIPFYFYTEMNILNGIESSEIPWVTKGIYKGSTYFERFNNAFFDFFGEIHLFSATIPIWIFAIPLWGVSFIKKKFRILNFFFIIPFYIIWALFFSYDVRNVSIILPVFSICIGFGIELVHKPIFTIVTKSVKLIDKNITLKYFYFTIFLFTITIGFLLIDRKMSYNFLYSDHIQKEKMIGNNLLNLKLYEHFKSNKVENIIISNYQYLGLLPNLKKHYKYCSFDSKEVFLKYINVNNVYYLLFKISSSKEIYGFIDKRIKRKEYKEIFDFGGYKFVKIRK